MPHIQLFCSLLQKKQLLEVIVRNPTTETVALEAQIEGRDLTGAPSITLNTGDKDVYTLQYAPAVIGKSIGRLVKVAFCSSLIFISCKYVKYLNICLLLISYLHMKKGD